MPTILKRIHRAGRAPVRLMRGGSILLRKVQEVQRLHIHQRTNFMTLQEMDYMLKADEVCLKNFQNFLLVLQSVVKSVT